MKSRLALLAGTALAAATLTAVPTSAPAQGAGSSAPGPTVTNGCLKSVPEPGGSARVAICYSIFEPDGAGPAHRVPMIMHSHGWGGSRTTTAADFKHFLDAGYGVISFDQRGWGESGGHAHVESPGLEGRDVRKLVTLVSGLPWVQQDGPGDPRLGAIGGSYGGGYQFLGAFEELRTKGKPVFDAMAPQITWNDLSESIAPEDVVRTEWALALGAASVPSDALPPRVYVALVEGAATGTWPDGSIPGLENMETFFRKNGPQWHTDHHRRLDIPMLFGQGTTDSLFPLEQALQNWKSAITANARKQSIFVAYNGGHVLPALLPQGVNVTSDPCSKKLAGGDFERLSIKFFDARLKGERTGLRGWGKYHLATPTDTCTTVASVAANKNFALGTVATTETVGAPIPFEIAKGPIRLAGTPYLTGAVTTLGVNNRAFFGLAVGTSPADAHLIQNNVLPINEVLPVTGAARRIALPSMAVNVPRGQSLYLLASAFSDTFVGMGSRTPGAVLIEDTVAHLPVVRR
ncbi:MAG: peptidase [Nocardioides sp.]|nr:peptidase [Nocardioides sp.]